MLTTSSSSTQLHDLINTGLLIRWRMTGRVETVAESGRGMVSRKSKHRIQLECGEWKCWRGWGRPNLIHEGKPSIANGDNRESEVFLVQLATSRVGNYIRLITNLPKVVTTYTHAGNRRTTVNKRSRNKGDAFNRLLLHFHLECTGSLRYGCFVLGFVLIKVLQCLRLSVSPIWWLDA